MVVWLNRAVYQLPRNGTTTHTVDPTSATSLVSGATFTPTLGRFLLVVIEGAVTSTTPSGWTLPTGGSAVNNSGLYVWYRTAASGSNAFTTTHNGSNYPVVVAVYEFAAGTTFTGSVASTSTTATTANPNLAGLTGTNLVLAVKATAESGSVGSDDYAWTGTGSPVEDWQVSADGGPTDGFLASLAYVEAYMGASWQPTGALSWTSGPSNEALTFAVKPAAASSSLSAITAVVSTTSASVAVRRPVQVSTAVVSTSAGAVTSRQLIAATTAAVSAVSASATVQSSVSATAVVVSSSSASATSSQGVSASTDATTGSTASATVARAASATVESATATSASLTSSQTISAVVTVTSATTANPSTPGSMSAVTVVQSTVTASATVRRAAQARTDAVTTVTADASTSLALSTTTVIVSSVTASPTASMSVTAIVVVVSRVTATVDGGVVPEFAQVLTLTATIDTLTMTAVVPTLELSASVPELTLEATW